SPSPPPSPARGSRWRASGTLRRPTPARPSRTDRPVRARAGARSCPRLMLPRSLVLSRSSAGLRGVDLSERLVHGDPRAGGQVEAAGAWLGNHRDAHLAGRKAIEERVWEAAYLVAENEVVPGQEPRVPETRGAPAGEEMQAGGADSLALQQVVERAPGRRMDLV